MKKTVILIFSFICFGLATEVFFSAIYDFFLMIQGKIPVNYRLMGYTYIWMIPIYGIIPVLFQLFDKILSNKTLLIRIFFGVIIVYIVEFCSGYIIEQITGRCPWKYTEGWHYKGLVRFDYAIFWAIFIYLIDIIYKYLNRIIPNK